MPHTPLLSGSTSLASYRAYLIRLWQAGAGGPWRASAQSTTTQQVYHFAHIEELFAFLLERLAADAEDPPAPPAAR